MRDFIDNIRYKYYDMAYIVKTKFQRITDRTKYLALSFLVVPWLTVCALVFWQTYDYKAEVYHVNATEEFDNYEDIIEQADAMERGGSYEKAFDLIVTHRNNFSDLYTEEQIKAFNAKLTRLTTYAEPVDIGVLYITEDLDSFQPIYLFGGVIVEESIDPLYGSTHIISASGEKGLEQLEVTGLEGASPGTFIEFYGVPKFTSVAKPISVDAFQAPVD